MKRLASAVLVAVAPVAMAQLDHPAPGQPSAPKTVPAVPIQPMPEAQPEQAPARKARPAIYDESADARKQIAAAMKSAGKENRRVLIQWGGNWCGWCHLLHEKFKSDRAIAKELSYEYDVVLIDAGREGKNMDLGRIYGADLEKGGFPYLTVLDPAGNVIANQETGSLESKEADGKPTAKPGHDSARVLAFLKEHKAEPLNAAAVLDQARETAKKTDRRVFLHFGAPWCGWCKRLEAWLAREDVAPIFAKDYVEVKIDQDRMTGAKEVFARYKKERSGIPWFVILDPATGEPLMTSDEPQEGGKTANIGFPAQDNEIAYFVKMLKATSKKLSESEVEALKKTLEAGRRN